LRVYVGAFAKQKAYHLQIAFDHRLQIIAQLRPHTLHIHPLSHSCHMTAMCFTYALLPVHMHLSNFKLKKTGSVY
jgi:hypothetical protein